MTKDLLGIVFENFCLIRVICFEIEKHCGRWTCEKNDTASLFRSRGGINVDVFINPEKYIVHLPADKIIADTKVSREGIERYRQKIEKNEKINPLRVVKHPQKDVYAVLDGHNRYFALVEMGKKKSNAP